MPQLEKRQWWRWACATVLTLLLTAGMACIPFRHDSNPQFAFTLEDSVRGLVALVFLFDFYTLHQQLQIHWIRRKLRDHEQIFRVISENTEDLITVIDSEGRRLYSSPGYYRVFGYEMEELDGMPILDHIHPDDHKTVLEARNEALQNGVAPMVEYRLRRKDGEWRTLESNASPVRNNRGQVEKIVVVSRDITARKHSEELLRQREQQLRQAQKMEAVGRLSGGIAHDFNNLLGVIIGYSEALEVRLPLIDPLRKNATEIRKAGQRAAALTNQLLAFSRQQILQPKILDLNNVVVEMGKMLRRLIGVNIELTTKLASQLGKVKADQSQIEQIIVNLVVNARDAMPNGGKLLIETSNVDLSETVARTLPFLHPGPHVLLTVTDTGVGMDAETQRHVFEPFFTTKEMGKGTGLGLATVYGLVKQSGGVVGIDSALGKGATFKIFLPQAIESEELPTPDVADVEGLTGTGTILLVEDEASLLQLTDDLLTQCGYKVLPARDGIEALEIARSFDEPIDLLLTDVVMPKLGGAALARAMAHMRPETRIMFMTGHAEPDPASHEIVPPRNEILRKPYSRDVLIRHIREVLGAAPLQVINSG